MHQALTRDVSGISPLTDFTTREDFLARELFQGQELGLDGGRPHIGTAIRFLLSERNRQIGSPKCSGDAMSRADTR